MTSLLEEVRRRRTFAIISHPDAGKTTLTEKLLLFSGAIQIAGSVKARKASRHATSDWMEIEKQRGISVASSVMQMEYRDCVVNLLDTPGHQDFSEDTYRVLTAVDAALMVIDAAKGVETQTRKLFEVCRRRGVPIFTFMNKCDRPTRNPLDLLDELESVLGLQSSPVIWPLGNGPQFKGVFDRRTREVHLFERVPGGKFKAPVNVTAPLPASVPPWTFSAAIVSARWSSANRKRMLGRVSAAAADESKPATRRINPRTNERRMGRGGPRINYPRDVRTPNSRVPPAVPLTWPPGSRARRGRRLRLPASRCTFRPSGRN